MKGITAKQKKFVDEYLVDLNATQAAMRAGYSKKTAYSIGIENLKKPVIQEYIQKRQTEIRNQTDITRKEILSELKTIGFADVGIENLKAADKIKALEIISKMLGFDKPPEEQDSGMIEELIKGMM